MRYLDLNFISTMKSDKKRFSQSKKCLQACVASRYNIIIKKMIPNKAIL